MCRAGKEDVEALSLGLKPACKEEGSASKYLTVDHSTPALVMLAAVGRTIFVRVMCLKLGTVLQKSRESASSMKMHL